MKKIYSLILAVSLSAILAGQSPLSFKYQAVLRNLRGDIKANTASTIGIAILQGSTTGVTVYSENHNATTDNYGLINLEIGKGTPTFGSMSSIEWGNGTYFIRITVDGVAMGTSQLLSVPYALYAEKAGNGFSGSYNDLKNKPLLFNGTWAGLTGKPTTIAGYGITDAFDGKWSSLTGKPTTIAGFGITDGVTTTGNQTIAGNKSFTGNITGINQSLSGRLGITGNTFIGTAAPDPSAALEVSSTSQGFLPPRMTYVQKMAVPSPAAGLIIWCSDCGSAGELQVFNGTTWTNLVGGSASASLPILTSTTSISSITETGAITGGYLSDDGGAPVIARGVCWSTIENPTVSLSTKTTDGSGLGVFSSSITGLQPGTTYYVRAYATNSKGTIYGNQLSFTTTVASLNKIKYLRFESYYSADNGQVNVYEIQAYENSTNVALNKPVFANSYEFGDAVSNGAQAVDGQGFSRWSSNRNDPGPDVANPHFIVVDLKGLYTIDSIQLNIKGFDNWKQNFDFSVSSDSVTWSSIGKGDNITGIFTYFLNGQSITLPSLATSALTSIGSTTATSGGIITGDGGAIITARGVCWSTSSNPNISLSTKTTDGTGSGTFASSITGLTSATTYYVRAYATNSAGTSYGNEISFKTLDVYANKYLFRDTTAANSGGNGFFALNLGYAIDAIQNTFTYDLWVKPTRSINMAGESNACSGDVSVPLANSNQNWAIVPPAPAVNMAVGLTIGTNGIMVGEHSGNILVSRLSYTVPITDWVHVAVVYRPDSIFLYLNGNLVRSRQRPCSNSNRFVTAGLTGYYYSPDFKGDIDEFRLWDIALTRQEVMTVKDKKLVNQVAGLRYYAGFDNGTFERTLGDIGTANMTVTGLIPSKHIKTSTWNLVRYTGSTIGNLVPY